MKRPTEHDAALEAMLAAFTPAPPSVDLRKGVAAALASPAVARTALVRWLGERLVWACGGATAGAIAASLAFAPSMASLQGTPGPAAPEYVPPVAAPVAVTEEAVAWTDGGVQFLDDRTPARILRRVAVERHRPAGGPVFRVPREQVVLVPVAMQ